MATFQYKFNPKLFNEMYMTKITLTDGKIDKPDMEAFLRSLAFVIPPNIQLITEQTNEEQEVDVQSFEQKLNKSNEHKEDPNISADTTKSKKNQQRDKSRASSPDKEDMKA